MTKSKTRKAQMKQDREKVLRYLDSMQGSDQEFVVKDPDGNVMTRVGKKERAELREMLLDPQAWLMKEAIRGGEREMLNTVQTPASRAGHKCALNGRQSPTWGPNRGR